MMALYALSVNDPTRLIVAVFLVGCGGGLGVPVQTRLIDVAGEAQTLAAALNHAAFNVANALGPACAGLLTGSLVVEKIFNLPGLGKFFVISALQRDYTVVMGMVIFYAALILALNLIADLIYAVLDPRVRLS